MARRRLSDRQQQRIQQQQQDRLARSRGRSERQAQRLIDAGLGPERPGRIVVNHGATLIVEDREGTRHACRARRNLGLLVCGDRVAWQASELGGGVISAVEPRVNALGRPDARGQPRPIAANLDRIVVVIASRPPFAEAMIDRYLVAAELARIPVLLLLNKVDLLAGEALAEVERRLAGFAAIGYPVLRASVKRDDGLAALCAALHDGCSILVGQSGVGKSSLINTLVPDREIVTGALSEIGGRGRHTTTATTLYRLPGGGELIDSPGVWEFGPPVSAASEVEHGFVEFGPLLGRCQFGNCTHLVEPGCALVAAVAAGRVSERRFASYRELYRAVNDGPPAGA